MKKNLFRYLLTPAPVMRCFRVVLAVLLVFGLTLPGTASGLTIQEEEELSKEFIKVVAQNFQMIKDSVVLDTVERVGREILSSMPTQPFDYHFYVIKEDVYNAFATPAGHIYINSGLLAAMENESELAGILAHEISHVSARHISQKIDRSKKVQLATLAGMAAGVFLGVGGAGAAANAVTVGSMAAGQSIMLAYSREDEMQADQLGLICLEKAGYSGNGLLTVLEKIRSKDWFGSSTPSYLKTHPASEDRMRYIDTWMEQHPEKKQPRDEYEFKRARAFLIATYDEAGAALERFQSAVETTPDDSLARYGYGLALARVGRRKEAIVQMRAALQQNAFDAYLLKDLAKIYFQDGDYRQTLNILENSMGMVPFDAEKQFYIGRAQMELGRFDTSVETLKQLAEKKVDNPEVFYFLGQAYGKMNQLPRAHYYLGVYYHRTGHFQNARFHLIRARKELNDADLKRDVDKRLKAIEKKGRHAEEAPDRKRLLP